MRAGSSGPSARTRSTIGLSRARRRPPVGGPRIDAERLSPPELDQHGLAVLEVGERGRDGVRVRPRAAGAGRVDGDLDEAAAAVARSPTPRPRPALGLEPEGHAGLDADPPARVRRRSSAMIASISSAVRSTWPVSLTTTWS